MITPFWNYFFDPVLRASTLGSMLMCLATSLIGVLVFVRRRLLIGETLSHSSYPGVVIGVVLGAGFGWSEEFFSIGVLVSAFIFSMISLFCVEYLESKLKVKSDSALCLVLSVFFGLGVLLASYIQKIHAVWFKQAQVFLYGQAATMMDLHIYLYGFLALAVILFIYLSYRWIQIATFDRDFSKAIGINLPVFDGVVFFFLGLAIVIGMRSVGVVLMSGILIAPAVTARQLSDRLSFVFIIAGIVGVISAFFGNYLSVEIPSLLRQANPGTRISLPTGPMILLCASSLCFLALLFAPQKGLCNRFFRVLSFKNKCLGENLLKMFWKKGQDQEWTLEEIKEKSSMQPYFLRGFLWQLIFQRFLRRTKKGNYRLTNDGIDRAEKIVRLHRLWEVYLVDYLGQGIEKVHCNAEKMEHILTPELEKELTELLGDPKRDPHKQPIPPSVRNP